MFLFLNSIGKHPIDTAKTILFNDRLGAVIEMRFLVIVCVGDGSLDCSRTIAVFLEAFPPQTKFYDIDHVLQRLFIDRFVFRHSKYLLASQSTLQTYEQVRRVVRLLKDR